MTRPPGLVTIREAMAVMAESLRAARLAYREAGMPYGDTHDGFARWAREQVAEQNGPRRPVE